VWCRGNVDVFTVMAPKQGEDLCLEAPTTSLCVGGDSLAKTAWKSDGTSDSMVVGTGEGARHTKNVPNWFDRRKTGRI